MLALFPLSVCSLPPSLAPSPQRGAVLEQERFVVVLGAGCGSLASQI